MKPSFAIVGCGRVGSVLTRYLTEIGYRPAGFASRSLASAQKLAALARVDTASDVLWEVTRGVDMVFITTPDDRIEPVCEKIASREGFDPDTVILHCSGSLPSTILSSAKKCQALIGSMHPLQSFSTAEYQTSPFQGIIIAVEGEKGAIEMAEATAQALGGKCLQIDTGAKTLYHASAVVASNFLVTLMDLAFQLIERAGISREDAFTVLQPLVSGTLANIEKVGIPDALTGPIVRGDVETVKSHVREIGEKTAPLLDLYRILGRHTVGIAKEKGALSGQQVDALNSVLKNRP